MACPSSMISDCGSSRWRTGSAAVGCRISPGSPSPTTSCTAGVTASLADTMAYMAHATLNGITRDTVTTNLTVTYLYAASEEALNAEARVIKNGRKVLYGEVVITNDAGTRVAHATVTYLRLDYEPRG